MVSVYIKKDSIIHHSPFIIKIIFMSAFFTVVNMFPDYRVLLLALLLVMILYILSKIPLKYMLRTVKIVLPFIVMISIYDIIMKNYDHAIQSSLRITCSIALANLLSLTSSLQDILDRDSRLVRLMIRAKLPVNKMRLAIHIVVRSIPLIISERLELQTALRLRGYSANHIKILFPLLLRLLMQSDTLVDALYLRGER